MCDCTYIGPAARSLSFLLVFVLSKWCRWIWSFLHNRTLTRRSTIATQLLGYISCIIHAWETQHHFVYVRVPRFINQSKTMPSKQGYYQGHIWFDRLQRSSRDTIFTENRLMIRCTGSAAPSTLTLSHFYSSQKDVFLAIITTRYPMRYDTEGCHSLPPVIQTAELLVSQKAVPRGMVSHSRVPHL